MVKKPFLLAISGCKNSGKTTLITKLIPKFCEKGYKVATIKHDGHDRGVLRCAPRGAGCSRPGPRPQPACFPSAGLPLFR